MNTFLGSLVVLVYHDKNYIFILLSIIEAGGVDNFIKLPSFNICIIVWYFSQSLWPAEMRWEDCAAHWF